MEQPSPKPASPFAGLARLLSPGTARRASDKPDQSNNRKPILRFWPAARDLAAEAPSPFVVIVGLHSSGSSAVAAVCWHLGIHLGDKLGGYYTVDPVHRGFEEKRLARICEDAAPFPQTSINNPDRTQKRLAAWIKDKKREAARRNVLAGGKYPHFCRLGEHLLRACGENLLVIHCDRSLDESIVSLQRRQEKQTHPRPCTPQAAEAVQRWLWAGKREFLKSIPAGRLLTVAFNDLLADPEQQTLRIAGFLHLHPTVEQIHNAVSAVDPEARHVKLRAAG